MQKNYKIYKTVIALLSVIIFVLIFIICFKSCSSDGSAPNADDDITAAESQPEAFQADVSVETSEENAVQASESNAHKYGSVKGSSGSTSGDVAASAQVSNADEAQTSVSKSNSTAIPGYEALNLDANRKQQSIALANPSSNSCYFKITLLFEDGTVLWTSNLIRPGEVSEAVCLNQELQKGTYKAVLKYNCYSLDGNMREMNGAETKLSLRVN